MLELCLGLDYCLDFGNWNLSLVWGLKFGDGLGFEF